MIQSIRINNIVLIEDLNIACFASALNVITGETGAGKSIVLKALQFALGEKLNLSHLKDKQIKGSVEVVFEVNPKSSIVAKLAEWGMDCDDFILVVTRQLDTNGRIRSLVNQNTITQTHLKELGELLLDFLGQHAHQSLLKVSRHRIFLDRFAGLEHRVAEFRNQFHQLIDIQKKYDSVLKQKQEQQKELELSQYALDEIQNANILNNKEDEQLKKQLQILDESERLNQVLEKVYEMVYSNQQTAILTQLEESVQQLASVRHHHVDLEKIESDLNQGIYLLESVHENLRNFRQQMEFSEEDIEKMNERLYLLNHLKRKYGLELSDVLLYAEQCGERIRQIKNQDDLLTSLKNDMHSTHLQIADNAIEISKQRHHAAKKLERLIENELAFLGMKKSCFQVSLLMHRDDSSFVHKKEGAVKVGPSGIDFVEFLFSANVGKSVQPLMQIASGGELSRVMLAIKTVLANLDDVETLLLDEVDAGIGGEMLIKVAQKIKEVAKKRQVICITHSAHIAAKADSHYFTEKKIYPTGTITHIRLLQGEDRVHEVERMLAGKKGNRSSLDYARQLLVSNDFGS